MALLDMIARLGLNNTPFKRGLNQSTVAARRFGDDVKRTISGKLAAAVSVAGIGLAFQRTLEDATQLQNLASRLGIGVENLQKFRFAANQSGAELEDVIDAVKELGIRSVDALQGSEDKMDAFRRLGLSADDLRRKKPEELFLHIAEAMKEVEVNSQLIFDAEETMGEQALRILPAMREGFGELADEAERLGIAIDSVKIERLAQANRDLKKAGAATKPFLADVTAFGLQIGETIGKPIQAAIETTTRFSPVAILARALGRRQARQDIRRAQERGRRETGTDGGGIDAEQQAERIKNQIELLAKLEEKRAEARFDQLTIEEKISEVLQDQKQLFRDLEQASELEEAVKLEMRLIDGAKKLRDLRDRKGRQEQQDRIGGAQRQSFIRSDLAQIGASVSPFDPIRSVMDRSLHVQQRQLEELDSIDRGVQRFNSGDGLGP